MKTAVMQPYFLPYLGYWQLLNAVDDFVLLDDVNFIMRGYINRNNILLNDKAHLFTIPLEKPSQNKLICETKLNFIQKENFLKTITLAYRNAPFYENIYPLIEKIILYNSNDLTKYIKNSIEKICNYYDIKTNILISSEIEKNNQLTAQDRIIEICKRLNTDTYINAIGGQELYNKDDFLNNGINLNFIKMKNVVYKQFNADFIANLSFLDTMMFNNRAEIKDLLGRFELI